MTDRHWVRERLGADAPEEAVLEAFLADVRAALDGGVTFVQMREKGEALSEEALLAEARALKALCAEYGVPFVIDDNVELALAAGADGVHVGQSDMACEEARRVLGPDAIVGVTTKTPEQARAAEAAGASYLGTGAMFPTGSKKDTWVLPRDTARAVTAAVSIPVVGIGGIDGTNVAELSGLGLDGVAVISGIFGEGDIRSAAMNIKEQVNRLF